MAGTPCEQAGKFVEALGQADPLRLIEEMKIRIGDRSDRAPRNLLELEGLGSDVWQDLDGEEYLRQERNSWSG